MQRKSYFKNIGEAVSTTFIGARLTLRHLKNAILKPKSPPTTASHEHYFRDHQEGIVTLRYPYESMPVPDNGRYQLHNEIDDCIVCDKCAKICPVDCIEIEVIKSPEVFGYTSDGTGKRLYASKFDIDMAKCCFCGLCTSVCPTECLTMTSEYDFSTFNVAEMNFPFASLTTEEAEEKRREYEQAQLAKQEAALAAKAAASNDTSSPKEETESTAESTAPKPAFRPKMKAAIPAKPAEEPKAEEAKKPELEAKPEVQQPPEMAPAKPVFRPKMKPPPAS